MLWHFAAKSKNVRIHGVRIEKSLVSEIFGVGFSAIGVPGSAGIADQIARIRAK